MRNRIKKELDICLDVNENIGEESVAFLSVVVSKDKETGEIRSTIINVCDETVRRDIRDEFSDKLHSLSETMQKAFADENTK